MELSMGCCQNSSHQRCVSFLWKVEAKKDRVQELSNWEPRQKGPHKVPPAALGEGKGIPVYQLARLCLWTSQGRSSLDQMGPQGKALG